MMVADDEESKPPKTVNENDDVELLDTNEDHPYTSLNSLYVYWCPNSDGSNYSDINRAQHQGIKVYNFLDGGKELILHGPLNILLLCGPLGIVSYAVGWSDLATFIFSLLALAPLAERLGFITEQLAIHTNETVGGLLNATFGNATELIVSLIALYNGLYRLVQLSLLGSILSNLLLVLGSAFLFGGLKFRIQRFGKISSQINASLLLLSIMAILFPTAMSWSSQITPSGGLMLSRITSVFLLAIYMAYLYFQLISHRDLFEGSDASDSDDDESESDDSTASLVVKTKKITKESKKSQDSSSSSLSSKGIEMTDFSSIQSKPEINYNDIHDVTINPLGKVHSEDETKEGETSTLMKQVGGYSIESGDEEDEHKEPGNVEQSDQPLMNETNNQNKTLVNRNTTENAVPSNPADDDDDDEEEEVEDEDILGMQYSLFWLAIVTVLIAILSDALSNTIEKAAVSAGISGVFLAAIILPIVGNAAEHASAVYFAMKGKVDLTIGVAVGSSTQIALFVLPLLVVIGWMTHKPLDLNFGLYELCTLISSILLVVISIKDGSSNWLMGVVLVGAYLIVSVGYLIHINQSLS